MTGQRIGYIRVSSVGQNTERQLDSVSVDKKFEDKVSGKSTDRPKLQEMLEFVRDGDTVVVHSMDRLARNLDDLRRLVKTLTNKGVSVEFVKEGLTFTGEDKPLSKLLLSVMGAFAEFERSIIRERQLEGIALAKQKGVYKGRKKSLNDEDVAVIHQRISAGDKKAQIARDLGISRETLYKYLKVRPTGNERPPILQAAQPQTKQVILRLEVENNSKFVHGKGKSREEIEDRVLSAYQMRKPDKDGWEYTLVIPYDGTLEDLDKTIEDIQSEMYSIADMRNGFIEADFYEPGDEGRSYPFAEWK